MNKLYLLSIIILSIGAQTASTQSNIQAQLQFRSLTINDGLSNNHVNSIYQDAHGFMWFATSNGANRFDGLTISHYKHNPHDSTSILSNDVKVVYSDSKNNLWIGSIGGLNLYNMGFDNFKEFTHKDLKEPVGLVEDIVEDKNGKLWIGASNGLYSYDLNTHNLCHYKHDPGSSISLPADFAFSLMVDSYNNLWISVLDEGFCIFDQNNQKMTCFKNEPKNRKSLSGNKIERFFEDSRGNIWIGTYNNGLNLFDLETSTFTRFIPDKSNSYCVRVRAIFEDNQGNFFVGTRGGLYLMDQNKRTFLYYAHSSHQFSTLSQNSILCHFIDRTGCLWIGTFAGGVNYTDLNRKKFIHYKAKEDDNYFLCAGDVYSIIEDNAGNIWLGTDNGLNHLNRTTGTFSYYTHDPVNDNSLSYNDVKALELDDKGNLWIGTNKGGLDHYNLKTRKFTHYKHNPDDPASLSCNKVYDLFIDSEKNLWVMTNKEKENHYSDIQMLKRNSNRFIHLKEKGYFGIAESRTGDIWLGGIGGIWHFNKNDSIFTFVENDSIIGKVYNVYADSRGILWIGSEKGLVRYDPQMKGFSHFSEPFNTVYGILEDKQNNLWVSTNFGLIKFVNAMDSIGTPIFKVYDNNDGLQSKQFNYNAYYKSESGEMFFGGIYGFNAFYPKEIEENPFKPQMAITDLKITNEPVLVGKKIGERIILNKSITKTDELVLSYKDNVFTFEFAAFHYAHPSKNQYAYILEGFEKKWNYVGNRRFVTYTSLPPGNYMFRVKGSNNDGIWNEEGTSVRIIITPPFWQMWWFRGFVLIVLVVSVFGGYEYRILKIRKQREKLETLVQKRTEDLQLANKELRVQKQSIQNYAKALKNSNQELEQLAYVASHDLQEPLRMISSYLSLIARRYMEKLDKDGKEFIDYAVDGAKRMQLMINDLLQYSRVSTQGKSFEKTNMEDVLEKVLMNLKISVEESGGEITHDKLPEIMADRVQMERLLQNLLGNAIKYRGDRKPKVHVSVKRNKGEYEFSIQDNGIGIKEEYQGKIFGIFQQLHTREEYQGTGIGLAVCKKIVERHGGKIWVESEGEGKGSIFYFTISKRDFKKS